MTKHLLIDFETFGVNGSNCVVIDCSALVFEWERFTSDKPYTVREYANAKRFKLSVKDQVENYKWIIEKEAVEFWEEQKPDVRKRVKPKPDDLTVKEFADQFLNFVSKQGKIDYWWSRGNAFDPVIIKRIYRALDRLPAIEEYLKFWAVRDTRTWIDAKFDFADENGFVPIQDTVLWEKIFQIHDSSWDVTADLLRLQTITRAENDMELL